MLRTTTPERAQANKKEDEEKYSHESDYGDVASVGQRGGVRSLSWNHVSQIQHVAQRPACITAFYLDTTQDERKQWHKSFTDVLQVRTVYRHPHVTEYRKFKPK